MLFLPDAFSQKLKPVVVKKLEGKVYAKEEYSIIKRGKDKGKRHGQYVYSKYVKGIIGAYYFGLKDGEWKYDQSPNRYSEFYNRGHLDSMQGIKDGLELRIHFDEFGDTSYFSQLKLNPVWILYKNNWSSRDTIKFVQNGVSSYLADDTTYYFHTADSVPIGKMASGNFIGRWRLRTKDINADMEFDNGIPINTHTSYYSDGKIMAIHSFDSLGEKKGKQLRFYPNGDTASFQYYDDGHKIDKRYYRNGMLYYQGYFEKGRLLEYEEFDSSGTEHQYSKVIQGNGTIVRNGNIYLNTQEVINGYASYPALDIDNQKVKLGDSKFESEWKKIASFIGGPSELNNFIAMKTKIPKEASNSSLVGTVKVIFEINPLGEIETTRVEQDIDVNTINEAVRLIQSTSFHWIPATQDGFPTKMRLILPINFTLY